MTDYPTRGRAGAVALAGGIGLVGLVVGCGALEGEETGEPFGLELLVSESREIGRMDARVRGTVADIGGCVGFVDGDISYLVVWPRGTEATAEEIVVDGRSIRLGDAVDGAGGYLSPTTTGFPRIPKSCAAAADDQVIQLDAVGGVREDSRHERTGDR
ncbi:hypothetical protein [Nocardioides speluncae]|uniref:hypothetical protein n=1 Tax=Nocardioides speluncae TaxID=2670337 RepID=UPI0012B161ED|nr:hypothetical protein [Nocardioides speluncae]